MIKIGYLQVILLFLHHYLNIVLSEYRSIKITILLVVIIIHLIMIINYFVNGVDLFKMYFKMFFLTFLLFEVSKLFAFLLGILPRYMDAPLFISMFFSVVSIGFYLLTLLGAAVLIKKYWLK